MDHVAESMVSLGQVHLRQTFPMKLKKQTQPSLLWKYSNIYKIKRIEK
jgi:hypothetical protein